MSKIFFAGNHFAEGGPNEVNKAYIHYLQSRVLYLTQSNVLFQFFEIFLKIFICRVVIFSGIRNIDHLVLPLCRLLHKRILFIMHGCLSYEDEINHYSNPRGERNEILMLKSAHQILCVSEPFRQWVAVRYPEYVSKTTALTNGINWDQLPAASSLQQRDPNRIILLGGGRITKHNLEVCRAVALLNETRGKFYHIDIYGTPYANDHTSLLQSMYYTTWCGSVSHEALLQAMSGAALFIQNSSFEPFSLGVVEALVCGCDVLVSVHVGAIDVIPGISEEDLIKDPIDLQEVADKIEQIMQSGNNQRLLSSIDRQATSCDTAAEQLYQIAYNEERL